jgi:hypothetical protein
MQDTEYQFVYVDKKLGLMDERIYQYDLFLSIEDYLQIDEIMDRKYYQIYDMKKVFNPDRNRVIYVVYIEEVKDPFEYIL